MTVHEALETVRQAARDAGPEELRVIQPELASLDALAKARLAAMPAPAVATVTDPDAGPPYTAEEFAILLHLVDKDGKPQRSRVHNLVRRSFDPLPCVRFSRRALRIPRAQGNAWIRKQEERRG